MLRAMARTKTASGLKCVFEFGEGSTATFLLNGECFNARAPWKLRRRRRWPLTRCHRPLAAAEAALPEMQAQVAATEEMLEAAKAAVAARAPPASAPALPAAVALEPVAEEAQPLAAALPSPPDSPDATASRGLGQPPTPLAPLASPSLDAPRGGDSGRRSSVDVVRRMSGVGDVARQTLGNIINVVNGEPQFISKIASKQECVCCQCVADALRAYVALSHSLKIVLKVEQDSPERVREVRDAQANAATTAFAAQAEFIRREAAEGASLFAVECSESAAEEAEASRRAAALDAYARLLAFSQASVDAIPDLRKQLRDALAMVDQLRGELETVTTALAENSAASSELAELRERLAKDEHDMATLAEQLVSSSNEVETLKSASATDAATLYKTQAELASALLRVSALEEQLELFQRTGKEMRLAIKKKMLAQSGVQSQAESELRATIATLEAQQIADARAATLAKWTANADQAALKALLAEAERGRADAEAAKARAADELQLALHQAAEAAAAKDQALTAARNAAGESRVVANEARLAMSNLQIELAQARLLLVGTQAALRNKATGKDEAVAQEFTNDMQAACDAFAAMMATVPEDLLPR